MSEKASYKVSLFVIIKNCSEEQAFGEKEMMLGVKSTKPIAQVANAIMRDCKETLDGREFDFISPTEQIIDERTSIDALYQEHGRCGQDNIKRLLVYCVLRQGYVETIHPSNDAEEVLWLKGRPAVPEVHLFYPDKGGIIVQLKLHESSSEEFKTMLHKTKITLQSESGKTRLGKDTLMRDVEAKLTYELGDDVLSKGFEVSLVTLNGETVDHEVTLDTIAGEADRLDLGYIGKYSVVHEVEAEAANARDVAMMIGEEAQFLRRFTSEFNTLDVGEGTMDIQVFDSIYETAKREATRADHVASQIEDYGRFVRQRRDDTEAKQPNTLPAESANGRARGSFDLTRLESIQNQLLEMRNWMTSQPGSC